jgi:nitrate/nitrite transporter NarK
MNTEKAPAFRGWIVTFAGLGINLALGVLYTWSIIKGDIEKNFSWPKDKLNDPYVLCCLVFAFAMIIAGRCQDKLGPRLTATIGGLLVGGGLFMISRTDSYAVWLLGFGVLVGLGIGFGYSSATPPALKWFPPARTGLISGLVVAGFGLAPVYLAPTTQSLLKSVGLPQTIFIYAIAFTVAIVVLAQLLINPPAAQSPAANAPAAAKPQSAWNASPGEILASPLFYILWIIYFIGAGSGLMVISSISGMAKKSMGEHAFVAVAVMAIGNAGGRIASGTLSDKIGRRGTLLLVFLVQSLLMFAAIPATASKDTAPVLILLLATMVGFNYGANLALFPALTKDFWGLKNFGMNYGVLFTAWGLGSLLSKVQQVLTTASGGSFASSFMVAGVLLLLGAGMTFLIKPPKRAGTVS